MVNDKDIGKRIRKIRLERIAGLKADIGRGRRDAARQFLAGGISFYFLPMVCYTE